MGEKTPEYWAARLGIPVEQVRDAEAKTGKSFGDLTTEDLQSLAQDLRAKARREEQTIAELETLQRRYK